MIKPAILRQIHNELALIPRGQRTEYLTAWADTLGVSLRTLQRHLTGETTNNNQGKAMNEEYKAMAVQVAALKAQISKAMMGREPSTEECLKRLHIENPPSVSTINRYIRQLGYQAYEGSPAVRVEPQYPNEAHYFDFSASKVFIPVNDNEIEVCPPIDRYKYKREKGNDRVWLAGIVDGYTRLVYFKYLIIPGESSLAGIKFLYEAWGNRLDTALPFGGIPSALVCDNGSFAKSALGQSFCQGLGVKLITGEPYNPRAKGKIENRWRWLWSNFESFFSLKRGQRYTIEELDEELRKFCITENMRPHPYIDKPRIELWSEEVGSVYYPPADEYWAFKVIIRKVSRTATIQIDKETYEVNPELIGREIEVLCSLNGKMSYMDPRDGSNHELIPQRIVQFGEYRQRKGIKQPDINIDNIDMGIRTGQTPQVIPEGHPAIIDNRFATIEDAELYIARKISQPLWRNPELQDTIREAMMAEPTRKQADRIVGIITKGE